MRASELPVVLATVMEVFQVPFPHPTRAGSWNIETVEMMPGKGPVFVLSLSLDREQNPHLVFSRNGALVHAFKQNGLWTQEVVDSIAGGAVANSPSSGWVFSAQSASIVAGNDRIHIVYLAPPSTLKHAVRFGGHWSTQIIDERASSL